MAALLSISEILFRSAGRGLEVSPSVEGGLEAGSAAWPRRPGRCGSRRVRNEPDGPKFAFKFLNDKGSLKARERFRAELDALTSIDHPGIVKVVQHSQPEDDFQYYVMEYVDGAESLRRRMDRNTNPFFRNPLKAIDGFIQVVEALAACEKRRVVHRDLSPANVLVTPDGRVMLIDFGLCHIEDGQAVTLTEEAVGTPHYRPPECSGHSQWEPDIRADLYSAGKILWSMITNKTAFDRESPVFNHLSLAKVLPDTRMAWHLHHIFEQTIRYEASKRYHDTFLALDGARGVRRLIVEGYKPLEQLADDTCPLCGVGQYGNIIGVEVRYEQELQHFSRHVQSIRGSYFLCPFCFHASFVAVEALQKALADRRNLT